MRKVRAEGHKLLLAAIQCILLAEEDSGPGKQGHMEIRKKEK